MASICCPVGWEVLLRRQRRISRGNDSTRTEHEIVSGWREDSACVGRKGKGRFVRHWREQHSLIFSW